MQQREVRVSIARCCACAEIRIGDTGPGIAADDLKKVFEPFFTTKTQGMGIGLAIDRTIIESHQGTISAENRRCGGA